jgi:DNA-binding GntR family transcriptional regulator
MRLQYNRISAPHLNGDHQAAIVAIEERDAEALRAAISADISEGMGLIGVAGTAENGRGA